ncbi:5'-methylthioadenosine/adenosylhomocysteine nucleosidase [Formosa sp. L2A11]|uniref:5'-methylthioadenosine/adenosylhomocysteine nucleosidase n=1 Tax=Formosa sp. L2A11 TaxID=2686363 RepID=UPI00131ABDED|nr:5'-methylthioadenosine/adenosylhomocysteine nucleosidase [Formosa sp. L2A11]
MALNRILFCITFFIICTLQAQRIAIMGAMDEEIEYLTQELKNKKEIKKNGVTFFTGELRGKEIVLLKAGIGKVNAAYSTAILTSNFKLSKLIFTGVAGGLAPNISPGDIVISDKIIQYDFGKLQEGKFETWPTRNLALDNKKNPLYFSADTILLEDCEKVSKNMTLKPLNGKVPQILIGTIATGDTFVSDSKKAKELFLEFNALATEMEGAAVAQVCNMLHLPFIIIRCCSDNANTKAHTDYPKFLSVASINSAQMVLQILEESN